MSEKSVVKNNENYCPHCMFPLPPDSDLCLRCNKSNKNIRIRPHHLTVGTVLQDKYMVGLALGEGGFGITYIGLDVLLKARVAIKEYYPFGHVNRNCTFSDAVDVSIGKGDSLFDKGKKQFLHEAQTLARFSDDEGIVGVRDFFHANNTAYIIMDYLDGMTLKQYVEMNGTMHIDALLKQMKPVIRSLRHIHECGLLHRDISPDNIMLMKNGALKLLDFGASRTYTEDANQTRSVMLKQGYTPEEQYHSKGEQGPWTDVYALCATIYKCITGITPADALERVFDDELQRPSVLHVEISRQQEEALMAGLQIRSKDRIQSIGALESALYYNGPLPGKEDADPSKTMYADDPFTDIQSNSFHFEQAPAPRRAQAAANTPPMIPKADPLSGAERVQTGKNYSKVLFMSLAVIITASVLFLLFQIWNKLDTAETTASSLSSSESEAGESARGGHDLSGSEGESRLVSTAFGTDETDKIFPAGTEATANYYILEAGSTRLLTSKDIEGLTAQELMLARNEIYARHGRKFEDTDVRTYFEAQLWYQGTIEAADFPEGLLSDIEVKNIAFLQHYESGKNQAVENISDHYILPYSATKLLTAADLQGLGTRQLMLARNEIYARHGRKFVDGDIQSYFNMQSWYRGTIEAADFSENLLSDTEKNNVALIRQYEGENRTAAPSSGNEYILPDSSTRLLTHADVQGLTQYQLELARNEIYARHGRKFLDGDIQTHFNEKSWYRGTIEAADFSESMLSQIEEKNIQFIQSYEN